MCSNYPLVGHAKSMFWPPEFQGSQKWVILCCTWIFGPIFNEFLTVIFFSLYYPENLSFFLVSVMLLYLSKSLKIMELGHNWVSPAQTFFRSNRGKVKEGRAHQGGWPRYLHE